MTHFLNLPVVFIGVKEVEIAQQVGENEAETQQDREKQRERDMKRKLSKKEKEGEGKQAKRTT